MSCFCSESQHFHVHVLRLQICLFLFCYHAHQSVNRQLRLFSVKLLETTDLCCFTGPCWKTKQENFFFLFILFICVRNCLFQIGCWRFVYHKSQPTGSGDLCLSVPVRISEEVTVFSQKVITVYVTLSSWQVIKWVFSVSGPKELMCLFGIWWNQYHSSKSTQKAPVNLFFFIE